MVPSLTRILMEKGDIRGRIESLTRDMGSASLKLEKQLIAKQLKLLNSYLQLLEEREALHSTAAVRASA